MGRIKLGDGQMIFQESEMVELKTIVVEDIKKEIPTIIQRLSKF